MPNQEADVVWEDPRKESVKRESAVDNLDRTKSLLNEMGNNLDAATKELNAAQEQLAVAKSLYRKASHLAYKAHADVEAIRIGTVDE